MSKKNDNKIVALAFGGFLIWNILRSSDKTIDEKDDKDSFINWDSDLYMGPEEYDPFYDMSYNSKYKESKLTNDQYKASSYMNWRVDLDSFFVGIDKDTLINPLTHSKWKVNKSIYYYRINCPLEIFNPFDNEHYIDLFFPLKHDSNPIIYNNNKLIPWNSRAFLEFLFTCYYGYSGSKNDVDNFVSSIESATKYIDDEKSFNSTEERRFPPKFGKNSYSDVWDYAVDYVRDKYSTTKDNARVALLATKGILLLEAVVSNSDYKLVLKNWAWERLNQQKFSLVWGSSSDGAITIERRSNVIIEPINGSDYKFISLDNTFSEIERGLAPVFIFDIKYKSDMIQQDNFKNITIKYGKSLNMSKDYSEDYISLDINYLDRFTYLDNTQYFDRFLNMLSEYHESFGEQQSVGVYEQKQ